MPAYQKPFLTFDEQINLLENRGLNLSNREQARADLERIGYYRLSAYWYSFRIRSPTHQEGVDTPGDEFKPGYDFQHAMELYTFDRQLRLILLDAIERIEVSVRVLLAYQMGMHGPFSYLDKTMLGKHCNAPSHKNPATSQFDEFTSKLNVAVQDSREAFAVHYREKYQGQVPIWVAIELWDFGMLSRFFQFLNVPDREAVARMLGLDRHKTLVSWLESLNLLRNICAHHGRLFKRQLVNAPKVPKSKEMNAFHHLRRIRDRDRTRLYPLLCVIAYLHTYVSPSSTWNNRLLNHFEQFPKVPHASASDYGFPDTWRDEPLWSRQ